MNNEAVSASVIEVDTPSFLTNGIDLKRLLRDVSKQTRAAIDALTGLLSSNDEKIRLGAAKALLDLQVTVAKEISVDQMQRLIAEVKLNAGSRRLLGSGEDEDTSRPLVDFTTIQKVD